MSVIHLCNTYFESELEGSFDCQKKIDLHSWMRSHPRVLQLQFLPLLYANKNDYILVTNMPENPDPRLVLFENVTSGTIDYWGASFSLQKWAKDRKMMVSVPDWEVVKLVNSKLFSFQRSPKLPGSELLYTYGDVENWISTNLEKKVLKTLFGLSGQGHFFPDKNPSIASFVNPQFSLNLPVIGEMWMDRVLDFSTQWYISTDRIDLLGVTKIENRSSGSYLATVVGSRLESFQWAIDDHLTYVKPVLQEIQKLGFFGNLGIDAFVYLHKGRNYLHPLVEINARKTMSYVALMIKQNQYPDQIIRFSFEKGSSGKLPRKIFCEGKELVFPYSDRLKIEI